MSDMTVAVTTNSQSFLTETFHVLSADSTIAALQFQAIHLAPNPRTHQST
jgi:hypothetical protein